MPIKMKYQGEGMTTNSAPLLEQNGWAQKEFGNIFLGDKRLTNRLIKIADQLSESPELPINNACGDWHQTKAAYRFFKNENVNSEAILTEHQKQTVMRANNHKTVLVVQDTSYITYSHPKTKGLGLIARNRTFASNKTSESRGLVMHTAMAVTQEGLPIGIIDQKIFSRPERPKLKKGEINKLYRNAIPIEEKESKKWLECLISTNKSFSNSATRVITIGDREADIYELFELAKNQNSEILVRGSQNRRINKNDLKAKKSGEPIWPFMKNKSAQGVIEIVIPSQAPLNKEERKAQLEVRFQKFTMNPPTQHLAMNTKTINLELYAIHLSEIASVNEEEKIEWMLLTNIPVVDLDGAIEKLRWYCLRWRIEIFHKILKSGFKVESCRLAEADRLIRYLHLISIIAWRIFWLTHLSRHHPTLPCSTILANSEWKVLYLKVNKTLTPPMQEPTVQQVTKWIAMLGGFMGRKNDGDPGPIVLWRGWKRLFDLNEGWNLANGLGSG
jgi:hypothetical protein